MALGKYMDKQYLKKFQMLVLQPFQGLVVTILTFLGLLQVAPLLEKIHFINRAASGDKQALVVNAMDVVDWVFYFSIILYIILLASKIVDYISFVLMQRFIQRGDKERQQIYPLVKDIFKVLIWTIGFFVVLKTVFGVNVMALVAGLGLGGIVVAFALKDSLENLLASILIMLDKPFLIGDWIQVNGVEGTIEKLGFRNTQIRTFDKTIVSVPNKKLIDNNLENLSQRDARRVKFTIGADYGISEEQLRKTIKAIKEAIQKHPSIAGEAIVNLDSFGDSALQILIVYFVKTEDAGAISAIKEDINFLIYNIMYTCAGGIPYPTVTSLEGVSRNDVVGP